MGFTQPLCDDCWRDLHHDQRTPVRLLDPEVERCCQCGSYTESGIYTRIDPATVKYPMMDETS